MRDYQKQKMYNWECKYVYPYMSNEIKDINTLRVIANHIWESIGMVSPPKVYINNAYQIRSTGSRSEILLAPHMAKETTLVHELAHSLNLRVDGVNRFDGHGPNYIADFVSLLVKFYGFDVWGLLSSLKDAGLDVNVSLVFKNISEFESKC